MEQYKIIKDFPNYSVSNFGNVKNNKTGRVLKLKISNGYYQISLYNNGNQYTKNIHKLVAEYFIPNPLKCAPNQPNVSKSIKNLS